MRWSRLLLIEFFIVVTACWLASWVTGSTLNLAWAGCLALCCNLGSIMDRVVPRRK